nr:protein NLRC5-like [Misgurnus anguillicaudatus]
MSETGKLRDRSGSTVFSSVSLKSDCSKGNVPNFSEETPTATKRSNQRLETSVNIGSEINRWKALKEQRGIKSDEELATFLINRHRYETSEADIQNSEDDLPQIFKDLEYEINTFQKKELERFQKIWRNGNIQDLVKDYKDRNQIREAFLDITLHFLKCLKQDEHAERLEDELVYSCQLKSNLEKRYQRVFEGIANHGDSTLLNKIYTDLYITQGGGQQINTEHEIRQIEVASRNLETSETQIEFNNMFNPHEQDQNIRTVLTKGVAGIGKSVSVQKFVLDWAEGKENQDISFIFPLPFREMNLKEKEILSLMDLISQFFPEVKGLNLTRNEKFKVLFIFDGLDECRLPLKFDSNEMLRDVTSPASLDVLLTNLIKGNLFPSALIWITTRPAAAGKIPPECIDRVTEVRGFNDAQKVEYFRKRFTDENMANTIIDHVKNSKSLFIMCHIPVFCWISATVLQNILEKKRNDQSDDTTSEDTPKTLTQMYTHFFRFQIQQSRRKYEGEYSPDICWDKDVILSLGKLAFQQLEGSNLIFYDSDLEACGIDITKASVYSGMCTQIFKQETGIITGTMYCFVHLSIQEFTAALYAHLFLDISKKNVFVQDHTGEENNETMIGLLKTAVDKALESENGHLDLFLRFLLGLSLESNRPLLRGLLTQEESNEQSNKEIVEYIKQKFEDNSSAERSINLFYCLNELNDQSLVKEIQKHLNEGSLSSADLSPAQWSALVFVLLTSEEELEEFELQKFKKSDECLIRLSPVVKTSKQALLNDCNLTDKGCSALANVLGSESCLKDLNMNNNKLKDEGVKLLCNGLKNTKCELEILRLSDCSIGEEGYIALYSAVRSNPSHLIELDLSGNDPGESGVKLIYDLIHDQNCALKKVRLSDCSIGEEGYVALYSAMRSNPSHLTELDLSGNDPGESGVKLIYDLIQDQNCALKKVRLSGCGLTEESCSGLASVLRSKSSLKELDMSNNNLQDSGVMKLHNGLQNNNCQLHKLRLSGCGLTEESCSALASVLRSKPGLKELDMSNNNLQDSGVKKLHNGLENTNCQLHKLRLSGCGLTEESCSALASVLRSKPGLKELDMSNNNLQDSGVKKLHNGLENTNCQLHKLRLSGCGLTEESCSALASVLRSKSSLKDLDMSNNNLQDSGVKKLHNGLQNTNCQLHKLRLSGCGLTEESCSALASVLRSKPGLKELDLSNNNLQDSGVKKLHNGLQNTNCQLHKLRLSDCSIGEEGYVALSRAVRSNPSHLIELDLSENDPGESGVKLIYDLIQDQDCALKNVRLLKSSSAAEIFKYLSETLGINPLLQRELNLNDHKLNNTRVKQICDLLKDKHCRLNKLILSDCSIEEEGYVALCSAVRSNPSHLIELDLSGNDPGESGVKLIYDLIQDQNCALKKVRLLQSPSSEEARQYLNKVVGKEILLQRDLNLNDHKLQDSRLLQICDLLKDKHCRLNTLILSGCGLTEESCSALASVLRSKSCLKELDMSNNNLQDSGVKKLHNGLENTNCQLHKLRLSGCGLTEKSCSALASVLRSKSGLKELDMSNNNLQDSGVKTLHNGLENTNCQLHKLRLSGCGLTEESCSAFASVLRSKSGLKELDMSNNNLQDSGVKKLHNGLQNTNCQLHKLGLSGCGLTEESCSALASVLRSKSGLKELDMSNNNLQDSGVKKLHNGLENTNCQLHKLRLSDCSIGEEGYVALYSAVRSNPSHLIELDLSGNDPGESGVKHIYDLIQDHKCALKKVRFLKSRAAEEACDHLNQVIDVHPLLLKELNLSDNKLGDLDGEKLSALLMDSHSKVKKIILNNCELTEKQCSAVAALLSCVKEIEMNNSRLMDSGVKQICDELKKPQCQLQILRLSDCSIGEEGYVALCSAIRSNPHLIELDLSGNDPGESGVKHIYDLIQDKHCALNTVRFVKSDAAEEACVYLNQVLDVDPLLLKELNLSDNKLGDLDGEKLSALLMDSHSKVKKIILNDCELTEKQCSAVAALLSCVKEIEMNNSRLMDSGVKQICDELKKPQCQLQILKLSCCSIGEEGYVALSKAVRLNPSHLIELDLSGNDPGESGVKLIYQLIQDQNCALKKVRFLQSPSAEEAHQYLSKTLGINPLLQRELNLNGHKLNNTRLKQICDLLKDKHCRLNILR